MLDEIVNLNGVRDRRFRVEHAQHLAPSAAKRFGEHNTIASVQVSDINPLQAIKTAMFRKPPGWEVPWMSAECLPLDDSLKAHTISAAHASFLDHVLGSLAEGKYADFVVLPSTSWKEFADDIPGHVLATYVNGKKAYP